MAMIGHQTFDHGANFRIQRSVHEMAERLGMEEFFKDIDPDL